MFPPFMARLLFLLVIFAILTPRAYALDLEELRATIQAQGARWVAADSPLARLSLAEKRMRVGESDPKPSRTIVPQEPLPLAVPGVFDWREQPGGNYVTPVKDQGDCNGCWAFAPIAALESKALITFNRPGYDFNLSEQIPISCSGAGNTIFGGSAYKASLFLMHYGTEMESCYPFGGWDDYCGLACEGWTDRAYKFKEVLLYEQYPGGSAEIIKQNVYLYGPVIAVMEVYEDFFYYRSGVFSHVSGEYAGTHDLLVVGWDDANQAFICKNCYGADWGEKGYIRVAYGECKTDTEFGYKTVYYGDVAYSSPVMIFDPEKLAAACFRGANAKSQTVGIWSGAGQGRVSYDLTTDAAWLSCSPTRGDSTGEHDAITVNYSTSALETGEYQANITITGQPGITAYTKKILVTLKVLPPLPPLPVPYGLLLRDY